MHQIHAKPLGHYYQ